MRKVLSIIHYEYKMQMKRFATWGILLVALLISLLDNFPSATNLARLEFLSQPAYFIFRTIGFDGLIIAFAFMFLLSNRFPVDEKTGVKSLMMSSPMGKGQYIMGKLSAAFLYTLTMLCVFLIINVSVHYIAVPLDFSLMEYIVLVCKVIITSIIPISIFVSFSAVVFPAMMDIRLFYLLAGILFVFNASYVNSADASPFYLITSGDLIRLIWVHPKYPQIDYASVWANLIFLLVCGFGSPLLLIMKRKFWRAE